MADQTVLLCVQNLLGIGHLRRAGAIAKAMTRAGLDVVYVSGGMPVPHLDIGTARLVQLPPVRTRDQDFKVLVDEAGREVDDAWKAARRDRLLGVFDAERPAVVITELFPFGRRQMRFELLPLLERARAAEWAPKIISSMRDILVTKPRADRNLEIAETVERFYDHLLIHGDEAVISLRQTFPLYDRIAAKVRYTGYVVTPADGAPDDGAGADEVLVSAGGGAVGRDYMRRVFEMRPSLPAQEKGLAVHWRPPSGAGHTRVDAGATD
jgi:predicted glycosyltransferase